jgi:hypothetical protein
MNVFVNQCIKRSKYSTKFENKKGSEKLTDP